MKYKQLAAPPIYPSPLPVLPQPEIIILPNGLEIYILNNSNSEALKMEVLVEAGRPHEQIKLTSRATSHLVREGCKGYTAEAFAEHLDFHGASLSVPMHMDIAAFQLYTLRKHASALIPALSDAIIYPTFGQAQLDLFVQSSVAELKLELGKAESLAYRHLTEFLYGADHPYGYNSVPAMYDTLTPDHIRAFHEQRYRPDQIRILCSGHVTPEVLDVLQASFGNWASTQPSSWPIAGALSDTDMPPQKRSLPLKSSEQTAIKIGRKLFHRQHPDYIKMGLLNTVLGGYFGSRLMKNIREEQGLTYNIYSSYELMRHSGFLYIASEVNKRKCGKAIAAIHGEMRRLQDEPITLEELDMVKNYISGMMLMAVDGPLNQSNLLKSLVMDGLAVSHFDAEMIQMVNTTPEDLQLLAQQWLNPEDMWEVVV
jgi:zinc protease